MKIINKVLTLGLSLAAQPDQVFANTSPINYPNPTLHNDNKNTTLQKQAARKWTLYTQHYAEHLVPSIQQFTYLQEELAAYSVERN